MNNRKTQYNNIIYNAYFNVIIHIVYFFQMKCAPLQRDGVKSLSSNYVIFTRKDLYEINNYVKISRKCLFKQ